MGSAFHQLCPRYSGTLTPLPLRLLGYGTPLPFFTKNLIDCAYPALALLPWQSCPQERTLISGISISYSFYPFFKCSELSVSRSPGSSVA